MYEGIILGGFGLIYLAWFITWLCDHLWTSSPRRSKDK